MSLWHSGGLFFIGAERWSGVSKLIEETGELLQVAGKLMANGEASGTCGPGRHPIIEKRLRETVGHDS